MKIEKNTAVTLRFKVSSAEGKLIEESACCFEAELAEDLDRPIEYLVDIELEWPTRRPSTHD